MATRSNYTPPPCVNNVHSMLESGGEDREEICKELLAMTDRYDNLLQQLYRTIDNYSSMLQTYGPHHEVELGEPLSRFEIILRKALNASQ